MAIGPHTHGQRALSKRFPVTEGLTAETQKQEGRVQILIAEESGPIRRRRYE